MRFTSSGEVSSNTRKALARDWELVGEVNKMRAFQRDGQVVCLVRWRDFDEGSTLRVFAGSSTKKGLDAIATDLDLDWD